jgi:hypothetical protein
MDEKHVYKHHNTFWLEDRISVTFEVNVPQPTLAGIIGDLRQQVRGLNELLEKNEMPGVTLSFFDDSGVKPQSQSDTLLAEHPRDDSSGFPGIYLFNPVGIAPTYSIGTARVVSFLSVHVTPAAQAATSGSTSEMASMPGMSNDDGGSSGKEQGKATSLIPQVVNTINRIMRSRREQQPSTFLASPGPDSPGTGTLVVVSSASPTWLCGATQQGPVSQGCPLSPPIPVPSDARCSSSPGLWPFTLPELSHDLQSMTGDGVAVFVLDTLPKLGQITRAAEAAGENNLLLLDVFNNVTFTYPPMLDGLDVPSPSQPGTGKDIEGRSFGFRMPDHGLFVAGIIRDLAPNAKLECIRVLNDFCTGSIQTLIDALNYVLERMLQGDLQKTPVVISLSLVIPDFMEAKNAGIDETTLDMAREGLLTVIQTLVDLGVTFVASAGNEGDQRYEPMSNLRPNALSPAAFAYNGLNHHESMIPVGAVDKAGNATVYSCYPGIRGFATYGGDLPKKADIERVDGMTRVNRIDAPIGLYTSLTYPALSIDDTEATYPAPSAHGWAYWVGTSFATPIVSAVAARAIELNLRQAQIPWIDPPLPIVSPAATRETTWTNLEAGAFGPNTTAGASSPGRVIWAVQCQPTVDEGEDEGTEEVEVNITEVNIIEVDG